LRVKNGFTENFFSLERGTKFNNMGWMRFELNSEQKKIPLKLTKKKTVSALRSRLILIFLSGYVMTDVHTGILIKALLLNLELLVFWSIHCKLSGWLEIALYSRSFLGRVAIETFKKLTEGLHCGFLVFLERTFGSEGWWCEKGDFEERR